MESKELNRILKERGIKQTWIADKLNVSRGLVNQWVKEVNPIPEKYKIELKSLLRQAS
jgi:predicted transcriptional regulator